MTSTQQIEVALGLLREGKNVLFHGCGGAGKSYAIKAIVMKLSTEKRICVTATTGIAALGISAPEVEISASTLHSWAGIGLGDDDVNKLIVKVQSNGRARKRWVMTNLLIVDEVSMLGAQLFDKLNAVGKAVRRSSLPFGGIQLLLSGDFLQLAPVKARWVFESDVWESLNIQPVLFYHPHRYISSSAIPSPNLSSPDGEWFQSLLRIRQGTPSEEDVELLLSRRQAYIEKYENVRASKKLEVRPTILYSRKIDVDAENFLELEKLATPLFSFIADDTFVAKVSGATKDYYMKPLEDSIPSTITLKVGAQVMLKVNLDVEAGLVNGSRGVVLNLSLESAVVLWKNGTTKEVGRNVWVQKDKEGIATRTQIPLILAWSVTCHKSQGCTLDSVICDVGPSIFIEGQAYVALSRVRCVEGLFLMELDPSRLVANEEALRFVEKIEGRVKEPVISEIVESDDDEEKHPSMKILREKKKIRPVDLVFCE